MHSDAKLYYAMLGLPPDATEEAIRVAFRRRAKELHPDHPGGSAGAFIRLKRAYDTLNDPSRRANYDRACLRATRRRLRRDPATMPTPPRPPRRGAIGVARTVFATIVMAGLSFGFIEALISYTTPPPPAARLAPVGPSLFDQPSPAASRSAARDTEAGSPVPRDDADAAAPSRSRRDPRLGAAPDR